MTAFHIPAYQEKRGKGLVRHVYVRTNRRGQSLFCLLVNGTSVPHEAELVQVLRNAEPGLTGVVLGVNETRSNVILGGSYRTLWGNDFLDDTLCGLTFRLSVPSFYQVNPEQTEVSSMAKRRNLLRSPERKQSCTLLRHRNHRPHHGGRAGAVIGAEVVPEAVRDAQANAERNGITNARFLCGDAGEAARRLAQEGLRPDVVCVDPPRKGLREDVVETAASMAPQRIVYVSCDPATLARDLARFAQCGYSAQKAVAVDMFPRTAHVETVCQLIRADR